jgi:hypothetical protein
MLAMFVLLTVTWWTNSASTLLVLYNRERRCLDGAIHFLTIVGLLGDLDRDDTHSVG